MRNKATNNRTFPLVQYIGGPYYNDASSNKLLFPFTFLNGTLDIDTSTGFDLSGAGLPGNIGISGSGGLVRYLGGQNLVQNIGSNFKKYIFNQEDWDDSASKIIRVSDINSIKVYKTAIVTKVQQLSSINLPDSINTNSYALSASPSDSFAFLNNGVTYAFDTPLVISFNAGTDGIKYLTFFSTMIH